MTKSAPPGFMRVNDIKGPSVDQVVFEIMICSRPLRTSKDRFILRAFLDHQLDDYHHRLLDQGHYYAFIQELYVIISDHRTPLSRLLSCRDWLKHHSDRHTPFRFELGMLELMCFLVRRRQPPLTQGDSHEAITLIRTFYWQNVYPHFFIGFKLTQLARQQFSRQSDQLESIILRQYIKFAQSLIQHYCGHHIDFNQAPLTTQIANQQQWRQLLTHFVNKTLDLPPLEWVKASVNRRWNELDFFRGHNTDLCDADAINAILNRQLEQTSESLRELSFEQSRVVRERHAP